MRVHLKLFAVLRDRAGCADVELELPDGATVASAIRAAKDRVPSIASLVGRAAPAVNLQYASADTTLRDGDELALIPPVSGGCA